MMKGKLLAALAVMAFIPMLLLKLDTETPHRAVMPEQAQALDSRISSPVSTGDSEYRILIFESNAQDLPAPLLAQEQPEQGEPVSPQQGQADQQTYGWGYYWWWWIIIAAVIIFFIIIFTSFGGKRRGGHPPEDRL